MAFIQFLLATLFCVATCEIYKGGILYPKESETREVLSLDGLWNFALPENSRPFEGFEDHWYKKSLKSVS